MSAGIYYFSGTGNSYYIAKGIAEGLSGQLIPIASVIGQEDIVSDADCIGIVFPVYYGNLPNIMQQFALRLDQLASKYIFLVCNYGGGKGGAVRTIKSLLRKNNGKAAAVYGIHMPQNSFNKAKEKPDKLYAKADAMVRLICSNTNERKSGFYSSDWIADILQSPLYWFLKPAYQKHLAKLAEGNEQESRTALIYRLDKTFSVSDDCQGCGRCAKVCPVKNIVLIQGKPVWLHHCENCIACYNSCPNKAIGTQLVEKDYFYRHPAYQADAAITLEQAS